MAKEGSLIMLFGQQKVALTDGHDQDCCENVYADFEQFNHYLPQLTRQYKQIEIRGVKGDGFLVCLGDELGYDPLHKVFIPCYNIQNGYYSDNLSLTVEHGPKKETLDLSDCKEDQVS
jgi:hypothetical protein